MRAVNGDDHMRAAVRQRGGRVEVQTRPRPTPRAGEVLIEVSHCGVCGTDLHDVLDGWGAPGRIGGHEYSGRIVGIGPGVEGWAIDTPVVGGPVGGCGTCDPCASGRPSVCDNRSFSPGVTEFEGAFAEYVKLPADRLVALPDGLSVRHAALAEPLAVAMHAITVSRWRPDQQVIVFGVGPIGALIAAALMASGVRPADLTVVEPSPERQALALALGAATVIGPDMLEVPSIAEPARIVDGAVHVVFECSGHRSAMEAGLAQLRRVGTLVIVGSGMDPPHFDANRILLNELTVTGAFNYDAHGFEAALDLLASGKLPLDLLVHPVDVGLHDLRLSMEQLRAGEIRGKVLVDPKLTDGANE